MAERGIRAKIDTKALESLAGMGATDEEIAGFFDVNVRTIERRKKDPTFVEAMERGRAKGKLNLRRIQLKLAETNPAMAIFLGKQMLGQSDHAAPVVALQLAFSPQTVATPSDSEMQSIDIAIARD